MKHITTLITLAFLCFTGSITADNPKTTIDCISYRNHIRKDIQNIPQESITIPCVRGNVFFSTEATGDVNLDVTLNWDHETEIPVSIAIMGGPEPYYATLDGYPADAPGFYIPIPPEQQGIKQVVLLMQRTTYLGFNGEYKFLIFPDCNLTQDCDLVINTADANKLISFETFNPDGEKSALDNFALGEEGPEPIENGNIRTANIETYLRYKNHTFYPNNTVMNMDFEMNDPILGKFPGLALKNVYVNQLTDDWKLVQYRSMFASDRENQYTVILESRRLDGDNTIVSNDPDSYSIWEPEFEQELDSEDQLYTIYPCLRNNGSIVASGPSIYINDDKCWTSIPTDISEGLSVINFVTLNTSSYESIITSPKMEFCFGGPKQYLEYPIQSSLAATASWSAPISENPHFDIPFSNENILGATSPFMVLAMTMVTESEQLSYPTLQCNAAGSLGELLTFANSPKHLLVSCNGNQFFKDREFKDYSQIYVDAGSPKGNMLLNADFSNFSRDNLPGKVTLKSKWNNSDDTDDTVPPTLTFLQLKNKNDIVTSRFQSPEDAVIAFSAGDFEPQVIWNAIVTEDFVYNHDYVEYRPLTEVHFELAPYGTNDFVDMPITEIPENLVKEGFGAFYSVDIATLDVKSETGWFDIRIKLTDAKENTQEQTISPAFKIESLSSVKDVNSDREDIYVIGNSIIAPSDARVYSAYGVEYGKSNLPEGIYIVKTDNYTTKIIIK